MYYSRHAAYIKPGDGHHVHASQKSWQSWTKKIIQLIFSDISAQGLLSWQCSLLFSLLLTFEIFPDMRVFSVADDFAMTTRSWNVTVALSNIENESFYIIYVILNYEKCFNVLWLITNVIEWDKIIFNLELLLLQCWHLEKKLLVIELLWIRSDWNDYRCASIIIVKCSEIFHWYKDL